MRENYNKPWLPNDDKAKDIFLATGERDVRSVSNLLDKIQTFAPIVNPVFMFSKNWKIALVTPNSINSKAEEWDDYFFSSLERLDNEFAKKEFYWTCLSNIRDLSEGTYSYQQFNPAGIARASLTLENYIVIRSSMPYICTETIVCFNSSLDILIYQIAGEYILIAANELLLKKIFAESQYKGWSILDNNSPFYGNLNTALNFAKTIYEDNNMAF
ncbi:hypothetical protein [Psychrobacter sp. I-STPA6b]|uniref:hypothetical protein n=1 Tax=Psychrobacter sp. I-STPA6b TaxID=2585718 RepID=UPI001D0C7654|nr:hypothetical protein [Psychrobacter sp. I-STPA6b]